MNDFKIFSLLLPISLGLMACSSNDPKPSPEPDKPIVSSPKQIKINASTALSRVSDSNFEQGDRVGIFVVNRTGSTPGSLLSSGNHVDNMAFTLSGSWNAATPIYWKDDNTHADFYLYYPYTPSIASVESIPFSVKADQSAEGNYKNSELLAGSTLDVTPTENSVNITARHLMSQINIILENGEGFTAADLSDDKVSVKINNVRVDASLNLKSAEVSPAGAPAVITPCFSSANKMYRALLPPQTVEEGNLITVTVDGRDFNLRKAFTFEGGKVHKFTVRVSKTSNGVNVSISPWETDGIDNGGVAE